MPSETINLVLAVEKSGNEQVQKAISESEKMISEAHVKAVELEQNLKKQAIASAKSIISKSKEKSLDLQNKAMKNAKIKADEMREKSKLKCDEAVKKLIGQIV